MKTLVTVIACLTLLGLISGCGSTYRTDAVDAGEESKYSDDVIVEAYLFDARLHRDRKPTSVRLEFYHTDSVIAIAGRGYLGKGALRGRLTADSLEVYFPTTDEFLLETVATVLGSVDCSEKLPRISLLSLFNKLPDSALPTHELNITADFEDERHPEYSISADGCPWKIHLVYALQDEGWRIREFNFDDGKGNTLKGKRRTYKREAKVKAGKFHVPVKPGSNRIIL